MTTALIILIALALVALLARTAVLVTADGLGYRPTASLPHSHLRDDEFDR